MYPNRPLLGLGSIAGAIYEAKRCAYLIGVNVGLRMMGASRKNIDDLLFDSTTVRFDICECRVSLEKQVINRRKWISTI